MPATMKKRMDFELSLREIEAYVTGLFRDHPKNYLVFHNLGHTRKVVLHCREIAAWYTLHDADRFILFSAAWFHDTGHLFGDMARHEEESVLIMKTFLGGKNIPEKNILEIENCIFSTRLSQEPATLLEKILCDADLYHLGTGEFKITDQQVKLEMELRIHSKINNWIESSIKFLESHHYFTDYCRERLKTGKEDNIRFLKQRLAG
jgi:predicted metal-dependent HD superfamily phosphohydrolase